MISRGMVAGANSTNHNPTSIARNPDSANVGTSGSSGERFGPVRASATSRFECTNGSTEEMPANIICDSPDNTATPAGPPPLYGMWATLMPAVVLNNSATRDRLLPVPPDAYLISPGSALASPIRSLTHLTYNTR